MLPLPPFVQVNAASSGIAGGVNREKRFDALAFAANPERVENFVPALGNFFNVRSFRCTLEPFVEFYCHRCEELPIVHSIPQVFAVGTASGVSGRPDPDSRHGLPDSVDYLL
jgi:hypothetical protein